MSFDINPSLNNFANANYLQYFDIGGNQKLDFGTMPSFSFDYTTNPSANINAGMFFPTLQLPDFGKLMENAFKVNEQYMKAINEKNQFLFKQLAAQQNAQTSNKNGSLSKVDEDPEKISYDAKELKEKWSNKKPHLTDSFYKKVVKIAKELNCSPDSLMAVMNAESGIKATAKNPNSSATGLIQFMASTAKELGTTTEALKNMSEEQQLKYVEKYLKNMKKVAGLKKKDFVDAGTLYALVFLPGRAGQEVLTTSEEKYYAANYKVLDHNSDGKITKSELNAQVNRFMA